MRDKMPAAPVRGTEACESNRAGANSGRHAPVVIEPHVVLALQQKDRAALKEVYQTLAGRFYAICFRILADKFLAEDAVQMAFVRIWNKAPSLRSADAFVGWACRIATNAALQSLRKLQRRDELNREMADSSPEPVIDVPHHDRIDLEFAIAQLTPRRRAVLVLYDVEGYPHREISEMLGISEGTSKAHLFHARAALKQYLER